MNKELSKNDFHLIMDVLMKSNMEIDTYPKDDGSFERTFTSTLRSYPFTKDDYALDLIITVNKIKTNDGFSYAAKVWYFLGSDEVLNGTGDLIKQALSEKEDDDEFISINRDDLENLRNNRKKTFELEMQLYSFDNFQRAIRIKKDIVSLVDKMF